MNTHDKILLGLSCHARSDCSGCPYEDQPECSSKLAADVEKMYKQLKRERDEARNDLDTLNYATTELHSAYEAMKRERDAAVEELKIYKFCTACKHNKDNLDANENSKCFGCSSKSNWQWRCVEVE